MELTLDEVAPPLPMRRRRPFDPPPEYLEWQAEHAMHPVTLWNGRRAWVATTIDAVRRLVRDHERCSSVPTRPGFPSISAGDEAQKGSALISMTDPPLHETLRRAVRPEFLVRRVDALRPATERSVAALLDGMETVGAPVDLIPMLAAAAPAEFTCNLLGVPLEDAAYFSECLGVRFDPRSTGGSVRSIEGQLFDYFAAVVRDRDRDPRDDLSGRLVVDHVRTGTITPDQAASLLHVLLIGGFDTSKNMIAMGTMALLQHPEQLAELRARPEGWPAAIEELLRYLSVVQYERRAVTADVEIDGVVLRAGEGCIAALHAANRDGREFVRPDELDLTRAPNNHVAFGTGIHQCLGQPSARQVLHVVFEQLFDRFPGLRLVAPPEEQIYNEGASIWGPTRLLVEW